MVSHVWESAASSESTVAEIVLAFHKLDLKRVEIWNPNTENRVKGFQKCSYYYVNKKVKPYRY